MKYKFGPNSKKFKNFNFLLSFTPIISLFSYCEEKLRMLLCTGSEKCLCNFLVNNYEKLFLRISAKGRFWYFVDLNFTKGLLN